MLGFSLRRFARTWKHFCLGRAGKMTGFVLQTKVHSSKQTNSRRLIPILASQSLLSKSRYDILRDVCNAAEDCQVRTRAEVTWNMLVHQPLLQHALGGHTTVQVEPSLMAKTLAAFSPVTSGRGGGGVIENRMVDFCLNLWLNKGKSRELHGDNAAQASSADAKLPSVIAEKVWSQPSDAQSVNQTAYPLLQFAPIACNIETRTSAIQQDG